MVVVVVLCLSLPDHASRTKASSGAAVLVAGDLVLVRIFGTPFFSKNTTAPLSTVLLILFCVLQWGQYRRRVG